MVKNANNFYLCLGALVFGIGVATFQSFSYPTIVWLLVVSLLCASLAWRLLNNSSSTTWWLISLLIAFFAFGVLRTNLAVSSLGQSDLESQVGQKVTLSGLVDKEPEQTASSLQLIVKTAGTKIIVTTDRYMPVKYGDEVTVGGQLTKPESFVTDLGREFDYANYLLARGVEFQIAFATVEVENQQKGNLIISSLLTLKQKFLQSLNTYLVEPNAGLAAGLLLGVKQGLGKALEADFRTTGIIHIVVLSGYNIMLIVTFVLFILGSFLSKRWQLVVGILAIAGFALMVGLSATVVRACLMASLLLLAEATGRRYLALRALFLAGALMLLVNPYLLIYDIGFQLSFLATFGLIMLSPLIDKYLINIPNPFGIRQFILATLSTQIMVTPLLLYYMGQVSVLAIIVNVLVLPMVPLAMLLAFFTGLSSFLSTTLATVMAVPTYLSLSYIIETARFFASLPFASFSVPNFSAWWLPPLYLGLGWLFFRGFFSKQAPNDKELVVHGTQTKIDLSTWTLEEEFEAIDKEPEQKTKVGASFKEAPTKETPVFFR